MNRSEYKRKFMEDNYDRINLAVKKGLKEVIREHANQQNKSLNMYIFEAILEKMERDDSAKKSQY